MPQNPSTLTRIAFQSVPAKAGASLALLFIWGLGLNYIEETAISVRIPLQVVWILCFLWVHAWGRPVTAHEVFATLKASWQTIIVNWKAGVLLGSVAFVARPWSWAYQSHVCSIEALTASRFKNAVVPRLPLLAVLATVIISSITFPLLEEFAFRKWLLRPMLARLGNTLAILITAVLFAALHLRPSVFSTDLIFGLVLGYAAVATGSLVVPFCIHYGSNVALQILATSHLQQPLVQALEKDYFGCGISITIFLSWICFSVLFLYFAVQRRGNYSDA